MMGEPPVNSFPTHYPPVLVEIMGVSLPATLTIVVVALVLIPVLLGWVARSNLAPSALLAAAMLFWFAIENGRWLKAAISGDPDFASFGAALSLRELATFLICFVAGFVARQLWQKRTGMHSSTNTRTAGGMQ